MNKLQKARQEKRLGELIIEGEINEEEAKTAAKHQKLSYMMVDYWAKREYEKQARAGHGYS